MAKILCIDDDHDILDTCAIILKKEGHQCECVDNPSEGLRKAKEFVPDMIILDVMMDDITDGFHVAYDLRRDPSLMHKPILMLTSINQCTGFGFNKDKDGSFLPVDEFAEKPVSSQKLIEITNKLLHLKKHEINVHGKKSIY